jgi:hypothetical protein
VTDTSNHIWYASYGSNLLAERFHCYIRGGCPTGSNKTYQGCRDKTLPVDNEEVYINSELYFAKKSATWDNGGVAFIKVDFEANAATLGRMYLITKEQFIDVVKQETANANDLIIDFERAIKEGSLTIKKGSWYGSIIYLGDQYGSPIFTFTHETEIAQKTKPSENYLRTIVRGINEVYNLNATEVFEYLISKEGIKGSYRESELMKVIEEASH